ncbi:hypothetical protein [Hufsiella ginkgonis]|uniref:Uncharacterized protein n=1 Tax=Hufsiella ginkgonis TaxID=2695274 RepID=A0A7K1XX92_9SPHI|nr:hypothetical protein [Hufsiella ginkgonis]MXV15610.1 hypothetical protein [Hufsiella ginkgonis]
MKLLTIALLLSLMSCGRESSPEGRSQLRDEKLHAAVDSLKAENLSMMDSIRSLSRQIQEIKGQ